MSQLTAAATAERISLSRPGTASPLLVQRAAPDRRTYLHPLLAPVGEVELLVGVLGRQLAPGAAVPDGFDGLWLRDLPVQHVAEHGAAEGLRLPLRGAQHRRRDAFRRVAQLLARPMAASQLDPETLDAFAADLLVAVLQTIGRGLRKRMPVEVYFVDAAWAPNSARGLPDTRRSSVLVAMRAILLDLLASPDPSKRAVYQELYGPFEAGTSRA